MGRGRTQFKRKDHQFSYQTLRAHLLCAKCSTKGSGESEGTKTWVLPSRDTWGKRQSPFWK